MSGLTVHFERIEFEPGGVRGRELPLMAYDFVGCVGHDGEFKDFPEPYEIDEVDDRGERFLSWMGWRHASVFALYVPVRVEEEER